MIKKNVFESGKSTNFLYNIVV